MLIIDLACGVYLLVILYELEREEHQYRRQHDQDQRKNRDNFREANNAPTGNLGKLGSGHENLGMLNGDQCCRRLHWRGFGKALNLLTMPLNLGLKFFGCHKIKSALTQPNESSSPTAGGGSGGAERKP